MKQINLRAALLMAWLSSLFFCYASAQDTWKFRKDKNNIIAVNVTTGKEKVIFKGGHTDTVDDGDSVSTDIDYAIVSYVGSYVTVLKSYESMTQHAAHGDRERTFEVLDAGTGKAVKLNDLFNERDILNAMLQDSYVKGALKEGAAPKNLKDLASSLNDTDLARFGDYMYGSFAFHHVEPGKVAMRMGLAYSYGVSRGAFTQLGFFLPIPEKLKAQLAAAATNKTLMKDLHPKIPQVE